MQLQQARELYAIIEGLNLLEYPASDRVVLEVFREFLSLLHTNTQDTGKVGAMAYGPVLAWGWQRGLVCPARFQRRLVPSCLPHPCASRGSE